MWLFLQYVVNQNTQANKTDFSILWVSGRFQHTLMASPFQKKKSQFADFFIMSFKESINRYIFGLIYELRFADLSEMWLLNRKQQQEKLVE